MQKKLTITVDEDVYKGLHAVIGRGKISAFINRLARPFVVSGDIEDAYRAMAQDYEQEKQAAQWVEGITGDLANEEG